MRFLLPLFIIAVAVVVDCDHTFFGSNVGRPLLERRKATYNAQRLQKTVKTYSYNTTNRFNGPVIQGILAYDLTDSGATANVTNGGIGYRFVDIRMKSDRGKPLKYDIYIYG